MSPSLDELKAKRAASEGCGMGGGSMRLYRDFADYAAAHAIELIERERALSDKLAEALNGFKELLEAKIACEAIDQANSAGIDESAEHLVNQRLYEELLSYFNSGDLSSLIAAHAESRKPK